MTEWKREREGVGERQGIFGCFELPVTCVLVQVKVKGESTQQTEQDLEGINNGRSNYRKRKQEQQFLGISEKTIT